MLSIYYGEPEDDAVDDHLQRRLQRARAGDPQAREDFLAEYAPFARAAARRTVGRYVHRGDDFASVALMGLNEAIDACGEDRLSGGGFLSFAEMVIRRRVIDELRRSGRFAEEIPLSSVEGEETRAPTPDIVGALRAEDERAEGEMLGDEISRLEAVLRRSGFTFADLARVSPTRRDARERCFRVATALVRCEEQMEELRRTGRLPLAKMEDGSVARKTLERHRRYIIAVATILAGDFPFMREYVGLDEGEAN